jgi:putative ABC transport system permease protein
MKQITIDENFLATYDIPLLHGRALKSEIASDTVRAGVLAANVLVNELALSRLGFASAAEALNQTFYDVVTSRAPRAYTIVGVFPDQNIQGFHNEIKPTTLKMHSFGIAEPGPGAYRFGSVRITGGNDMAATRDQVEMVWDNLIDDYPMQSEFLDDTFAETFEVYASMTYVLAAFAFLASALSLVGLFGLAAFMAESRTREIGLRKVMGADTGQIVRLLVWQFSRPVLWALLIALPGAYLAADMYLNFFAERIELPEGIIVFAGLLSVFVSWAVVAMHAIRVAGASPINALRYE